MLRSPTKLRVVVSHFLSWGPLPGANRLMTGPFFLIALLVVTVSGIVSGQNNKVGQTNDYLIMRTPSPTPHPGESIKIHQEIDFKASPQRIYEALLDAKQFAAFSGRPAEINPE